MISDTNKEALKKYFADCKDIAFAFLFGSQATGNATKLSDVDIAVYFYPEIRMPLQYEEDIYYENEDGIWSDLEKLLNREVELVVLNRASSTVASSAIRGAPLAINDWGLYLDFMKIVTAEAEDFMDFLIKDYWEREGCEKRG